MINYEVSLTLTWSANYVITNKAYKEVGPDADPAVVGMNAPTNATFKMTDTKLYVPVVTLSIQDDTLLEQLKTGFKRTIKWNKYRCGMSNQNTNNDLNYLIDPTFIKGDRLFVLSFENEDDRISLSKYYTPNVEIKDFNVLMEKVFLALL